MVAFSISFTFLKDFHVREDEELFLECIPFVGVFLLQSFLKDGYLHLLLIDLIANKDDLFVFLAHPVNS